ncbi:MAG: hypothetical protein KDE27_29895 [Planctomycetes bacterium]|nr:hypothetical protein [Planctomycetota bacterium]
MSLSALLLSAAVWAVPEPVLELAVLPDGLEARVAGKPGTVGFVLCLGLGRGATRFEGGVELGIVVAWQSELVAVDADGVAFVRLDLPAGFAPGLEFVAQGVVFDGSGAAATPVLDRVVPRIGDPADVVVLLGQSNAEGYADVADLDPRWRGPLPMVRVWNQLGAEWQPLAAGVNSHLLPGPFFGPEIGVGVSVATRDRPLWLLKFTVSASSLGPLPGRLNEWGVGGDELYPILLARLGNAVEQIRATGLVPRVRLVCVMQGETDCVYPELASAYEHNLDLFCAQLRADLRSREFADDGDPMIRIGLVSPFLLRIGLPEVSVVRSAQVAVARRTERCEIIETAALPLQADRVHFSASGCLLLGRRFAAPGW